MPSIVSAVKRKLAFLASFITSGDKDPAPNENIENSPPAKRRRLNGSSTPVLRSDSALEESPNLIVESVEDVRLVPSSLKEFSETVNCSNQPSDLLRMLPPHVLSKCLAFVGSTSDRFALQTTCNLFKSLSNLDHMLVDIDLGGDWSALAVHSHVVDEEDGIVQNNGLIANNTIRGYEDDDSDAEDEDELFVERGAALVGGILTESDTSITACQKLIKFSAAGNTQAIYMLAMILCYCLENVSEGLSLLRLAASHGDLRSMYNLALILRDTRPTESNHCLVLAARYGYVPAWQEKLTPTEMRARFGDLDASSLSKYLDPPCLSRLLGRHYLECNRVKKHQTSHCWNPMCGRWAYKATASRSERQRTEREGNDASSNDERYSIMSLLPELPNESVHQNHAISPLGKIKRTLQYQCYGVESGMKVSRMKMCSSCRRAKYCSKLCQVYDWRSGRHKAECPFLNI